MCKGNLNALTGRKSNPEESEHIHVLSFFSSNMTEVTIPLD